MAVNPSWPAPDAGAADRPSLLKNSLTSTVMTGESAWIGWVVSALVAAAMLLGFWVWRKGRPFAQGDVFLASRISGGNRVFPTQVLITSTSVVHHTPQWMGKLEETIHLAHVASVKIDTGLLFSSVIIETSGGTHPIYCRGHWKGDAERMKALIARYQTEYYRQTAPANIPPDSGR
jgi:hypothetical protein